MKKPAPFGKYYLLERINVGGMAEVFRAKAFGVEGFERLVAVKRILPNIAEDKEFIRMFIEEAKLAVQLNHANIAQIFDLGVVDGAYYIALEHVHGRDLRGVFDRCRQLGEAMPVAQACFVVMKVCEGLDYAHNKRDQSGRELSLVHRDVSPQNVLVSFEGEVKIIDFGIAKAAGKGSKTQAGILKGKFGYMSPEQVRGIPIDRRSDVFSCGIVLYELLTGERLFVGESDFSTLEKVRNVEILPPSTYNRRIPDELERIVLKALAKDPEDRYANAIDLHDELQAFVYTAGEFYSRKDLAGWMKKTFGREIEEESAKLESYRQLKAPAEIVPPAIPRTATGPRPVTASAQTTPVRKATQSQQAIKPPPPPRTSQQLPTVPPPIAAKKPKTSDSGELAWDDDELETQIYDDPENDPKHKKPSSSPGAKPPSPPEVRASSVPPITSGAASTGPDLSSLVSTARGWEGAKPLANPGANGTHAIPPLIAAGSSKGPPPAAPLPDPMAIYGAAATSRLRESSPVRNASEPLFDPMAQFGAGMLRKERKGHGMLLIAVGGAAVAVVAVVIVIAMTGGGGGKKPAPATPDPKTNPVATAPVGGDQKTGFDLYVNPPGVTTWRLDGEARTDRLPSRIRGISPGPHTVAIDAPPGFMSQNQPVNVEAGKAPKIEIVLSPVEGISGAFESTPPGATVSLFIDGKRQALGPSPAKSPLDPRKSYQVLFEKAGYVSVNRPIVFTGALDEKIAVNLEKAGPLVAADHVPPPPPETDHKVTPPPPNDHKVTTNDHKVTPPPPNDHKVTPPPEDHTEKQPEVVADKPKGQGTLLLGSKPPCEIFVDGSDTGKSTPQKDLKLPAGKHRITLVNTDFNIKETFAVDIAADQVTRQIKDFSDRLPK